MSVDWRQCYDKMDDGTLFSPGHVFTFIWTDFFDQNKQARIPAVVLKRNIYSLMPFTVDLGLWARYYTGEVSGILELTDVMIWRYPIDFDVDRKFLEALVKNEQTIGGKVLTSSLYLIDDNLSKVYVKDFLKSK